MNEVFIAVTDIPIPGFNLDVEGSSEPSDVAVTLQLLIMLTILSLAPAILIMMTCFTRIVVVLSFVRTSLATQTMPPNQVIVGLALFLTFFVMSPILAEINESALQPYLEEEMSQSEALEIAVVPLKEFMATHTREKDLALFMNYNEMERPTSLDDIPLHVLVPAFMISELKTAFQIGFLIFVPFLIIDMIVASTLMAMGMMMLPPVMISLPFKILLFVLVDGWYLVVQSLLLSF
nr:flagellar type III secretion system pore protein FliP [Caldalkalibacillus salinus]